MCTRENSKTVAVAVHYVGRLASTREELLDTKAESQSGEPVQVVAGRGEMNPLRNTVLISACTD
jgi:hypothetical protein